MIMIDRISGRSRGFGFITYVDPASVAKVMQLSNHTINGKYIECKRAETRQQRAGRSSGGGGGGGGGGGYGGGAGGYGGNSSVRANHFCRYFFKSTIGNV